MRYIICALLLVTACGKKDKKQLLLGEWANQTLNNKITINEKAVLLNGDSKLAMDYRYLNDSCLIIDFHDFLDTSVIERLDEDSLILRKFNSFPPQYLKFSRQ